MDDYFSEIDGIEQPAGPSGRGREEQLPSGMPERRCARVVIVDHDERSAKQIEDALVHLHVECTVVGDGETCMQLLEAGAVDVVIVDSEIDGGDGLDLVYAITTGIENICTIVTCATPDVELAVDAMRCGAVDMISKPINASELACRVESAIDQANRRSNDERRVKRLKRICKRLSEAQQDHLGESDESGVLCNDLAGVYDDIAEQMQKLSVASEYRAMIQQELDVEALLRTTLEFLLTRTGPTNAGIFLPTGQDDFNLGAYVNYDIPKDSADMLLDQLSDVVAHRLVEHDDVVRCENDADLHKWFGSGAGWLEGSKVLAMSCNADEECLAVITLFREHAGGFSDELVEEMHAIRDLFADQLARVVRIHHRHLPMDKWPGFDVETDDDWGMAA
jgi:FixJ family two-component response regulator